jgi:hypothetical protein
VTLRQVFYRLVATGAVPNTVAAHPLLDANNGWVQALEGLSGEAEKIRNPPTVG